VEPIHDARNGVYDHDLMVYRTASLPLCGFSLCKYPNNVTDWRDIDQIKHRYLKELEAVIPSSFPDKPLEHIVFWNPMHRGEEYAIQRGNLDDIHIQHHLYGSHRYRHKAFDSLEELVNMVENNRIEETIVKSAEIIDSISSGHRFAIVNFWRNIDPKPIERAPPAMLYAKHSSSTTSKRLGSFPYDSPDPIHSLWYTYPLMTKDECLLFLQYDRLLSQPSDLWHCALPSVGVGSRDRGYGGGGQDHGIPRRLFDIRALVVFREKIPAELDRFSSDRTRPILSLEESGCFCDDQASRFEALK